MASSTFNVNTDKQTAQISTSSQETLTALSVSFDQNSFNRLKAKITVTELSSGKMSIFTIETPVQRGSGSCNLPGTVEAVPSNGDLALLTATATVIADGAAALVKVTGIAGLDLDWVVQADIDKFTVQ